MFLCDSIASTTDFPSIRFLELPERLENLISDPEVECVEDLCTILGVSHARLIRLCRRHFGHTPKYLMRRARFARMIAELRTQPYRQWRHFLDPRYVDQSHFIRDCHYFLGMAPTRFLALPAEMQHALANQLPVSPEMAMAA